MHYISTTSISGQDGFLVVANKSKPNGPEGCIVPFVYPNNTGWIGFFCINAPLRGIGWGAQLFQAGLDQLKKGGATMVGLDAVEEQVATYRRRGFVEKGRIKLMTRKGTKEQPLEGGFEHVKTDHERLTALEHTPTAILIKSDLEHTGLERPKLWSREVMFDRNDAWVLALVKEGKKEELEGWILIRGCQHGWRFGPLYASSTQNAAFLLHQAMRRLESEDGSYIAEIWAGNTAAIKVFEDAGWSYAGIDYHRMWLDGRVPEAQQPGGKADKEVYAMFDAGAG
jgi:hypothetical protein